MNTTEIIIAGVGVTPFIVGLVEVSKLYIPTRFAPLIALALGILAGIAAQAYLPHPNWVTGAVEGVGVGLAASGLYSGIGKYYSSNSAPAASAPVAAAPESPAPTK